MVYGANLLNFVDFIPYLKSHQVLADTELIPMANFHSFFRNVHPCSILASKIFDVETFEAVILELGVFWCQSHSFNL